MPYEIVLVHHHEQVLKDQGLQISRSQGSLSELEEISHLEHYLQMFLKIDVNIISRGCNRMGRNE